MTHIKERGLWMKVSEWRIYYYYYEEEDEEGLTIYIIYIYIYTRKTEKAKICSEFRIEIELSSK